MASLSRHLHAEWSATFTRTFLIFFFRVLAGCQIQFVRQTKPANICLAQTTWRGITTCMLRATQVALLAHFTYQDKNVQTQSRRDLINVRNAKGSFQFSMALQLRAPHHILPAAFILKLKHKPHERQFPSVQRNGIRGTHHESLGLTVSPCLCLLWRVIMSCTAVYLVHTTCL